MANFPNPLNLRGPRSLNRVIPVDIARKPDAYAVEEINKLQAAFARKCFADVAELVATLNNSIDVVISAVIGLGNDAHSFEGIVDLDGKGGLFLQVQEKIPGFFPSYNAETMLDKEAIAYFLFCYAVYKENLADTNSIAKFMTDDTDGGPKDLYDYIVAKSVDNIIGKEKINLVPTPSELIDEARSANISFASGIYSNSLKNIIQKFAFNNNELIIINQLKIDYSLTLTEAETAVIIDFIKKSKVEITLLNAPYLVLPEILRVKNTGIENFPSGTTVGDGDFFVDYFQEDTATLEINRDNVLCAAQLYFVMTIGDEMDVFNVIHRIATRYLTTGMVDIRSRALLEDLQLYVFSDRFRDLRTGLQHERTRAEERAMFQSQVFGGTHKTKLGEGMVSNAEFAPMWENLMFETAKYLQKIEKSENPQFFVSRQNIAQAIEDLQYNLSTYCTGMVKVLAPLANRELDFVMKRFLQNDEIIRQLAPRSSTSVWKVIERILQEWRGKSVNVVALRNKAIYGHMILQAVANYSPALIDNDTEFSRFVNTVEAFIIANSQMEGHGERRELPAEDDDYDNYEMAPSSNGHYNGNGKAGDEWDF